MQDSESIGLNLLAARSEGHVGVERFVRSIVGRINVPREWTIRIATRSGVEIDNLLGSRFIQRYVKLEHTTWNSGPTPWRIGLEMVPLAIKFYRCTKVLSINNFGPLFGKKGQRRIIVIHDVWFMSDTYEGSAIARYLFGLLIRIQLLCVHEIITVSEFSRKEIAEKLGVAANRITVVPNCLDEIDIAKTEVMTDSIAEEEYFLLIGSDRANKNVANAVLGFEAFNFRSTKKALLIVVGTYSKPFIESIVSTLNTSTAKRVQFRNYVERAELLKLISSAIGIVFPSLYEGYGIPVIEAIAYNKAVLVARNTVCEELAGPFGVVVDANSVDSIAKGFDDLIGKVDTMKTSELSEYRASFFGCERSAAIMSSILVQSGDLAPI